MTSEVRTGGAESLEIDLRNPLWAAFWAWFCPALGTFINGGMPRAHFSWRASWERSLAA